MQYFGFDKTIGLDDTFGFSSVSTSTEVPVLEVDLVDNDLGDRDMVLSWSMEEPINSPASSEL